MLVTFDESQVIIDQYPIDEASCFSDRNSVWIVENSDQTFKNYILTYLLTAISAKRPALCLVFFIFSDRDLVDSRIQAKK